MRLSPILRQRRRALEEGQSARMQEGGFVVGNSKHWSDFAATDAALAPTKTPQKLARSRLEPYLLAEKPRSPARGLLSSPVPSPPGQVRRHSAEDSIGTPDTSRQVAAQEAADRRSPMIDLWSRLSPDKPQPARRPLAPVDTNVSPVVRTPKTKIVTPQKEVATPQLCSRTEELMEPECEVTPEKPSAPSSPRTPQLAELRGLGREGTTPKRDAVDAMLTPARKSVHGFWDRLGDLREQAAHNAKVFFSEVRRELDSVAVEVREEAAPVLGQLKTTVSGVRHKFTHALDRLDSLLTDMPSSAGSPPTVVEFEVVLERVPGQKMGLALNVSEAFGAVVQRVGEGHLVEQWNSGACRRILPVLASVEGGNSTARRARNVQVEPGDTLASCNGMQLTHTSFREALQGVIRADVVTLVFRKVRYDMPL
mmetsp:Transcript_13989/g.33918  ORF Transcript_13989/g.33918 Transcript_13989/m.33918 type:complete len:424 (+) Transcript_13989:75-1346(+)